MKRFEKDYYYPDTGREEAYLFSEGTNYRAYRYFGSHRLKDGWTRFVVWAPRAMYVNLIGDFNDWNELDLPLERIEGTGVWQIAVRDAEQYDCYKYRIVGPNQEVRYKADPFAFHAELRPKTASKVYEMPKYKWSDAKYTKRHKEFDVYNHPMSIYEVNLSSWRRKEDGTFLSYRELAKELVNYVADMGYTHVEFMPLTEYPYDGSWGYQVTGYFAATSRFGTPEDLMALVDAFHAKGIGVIMDWVPVHFCADDHGLARFDGTNCYEWDDEFKAQNNQWGTRNFDFSKGEVQSFLISCALFFHEYFHIDGFRVDAVAYMLYLDFTGKDIRNDQGGRENLDAIRFLRRLNEVVFREYPESLMIAEESTAWPLVSAPTSLGGLGFNFKWNMGWMHDILEYMEMDPIYRRDHQNALTFPVTYCFSENYILPFSHDEVVHGKKSLLDKMPGYYHDKFASLRLLYAYMYAFPGKKLTFMGGEFGQFIEWNEWQGLDFFLLEYPMHRAMKAYVKALNKFYVSDKRLWEIDTSYDGYAWIEHENHQESMLSFERIDKEGRRLIVVLNFTPVARPNYPVGVTQEGEYKVLLNTDQARFGGHTTRNKRMKSKKEPFHGRDFSIRVDVPPLSAMYISLVEDE